MIRIQANIHDDRRVELLFNLEDVPGLGGTVSIDTGRWFGDREINNDTDRPTFRTSDGEELSAMESLEAAETPEQIGQVLNAISEYYLPSGSEGAAVDTANGVRAGPERLATEEEQRQAIKDALDQANE